MTSDTVSDLSYADTLWKSADALRGQVDAAEYKHVVLGLLFLKYISDSFQSRRDELQAELTKTKMKPEQIERLLESRDEYTAERVFWVPLESRWPNLQNQATRPRSASGTASFQTTGRRSTANSTLSTTRARTRGRSWTRWPKGRYSA